jgi:hypothetical protein
MAPQPIKTEDRMTADGAAILPKPKRDPEAVTRRRRAALETALAAWRATGGESLPPNTQVDPVVAGIYLGGPGSPISDLTLQDWRVKCIGPAYIKCGRLIRYSLSDLTAWLDQSRVTPGRG